MNKSTESWTQQNECNMWILHQLDDLFSRRQSEQWRQSEKIREDLLKKSKSATQKISNMTTVGYTVCFWWLWCQHVSVNLLTRICRWTWWLVIFFSICSLWKKARPNNVSIVHAWKKILCIELSLVMVLVVMQIIPVRRLTYRIRVLVLFFIR